MPLRIGAGGPFLQPALLAPDTNPGTPQSAQYTFGLHAQSLYESNATRVIWGSVRTPPVSVSVSIPPLVQTRAQDEDRPSAQIWRAQLAGQTPPRIPRVSAAPQLYDFTQPAQFTAPAITPPVVSYALRSFTAGLQGLDLTQSAQYWRPTPANQGAVPALLQAAPELRDLTQAAQYFAPLVAPPTIITGPTIAFGPVTISQPDLNVSYSVLWTPSIYSPSAVPAPLSLDTGSGGFLYAYELEQGRRRKRRREQEEREEDAQALQDQVDREIAQLLRKQEAEDERRAELDRLQRMVRDHSKNELELSDRAKIAYVRALTQANFSAMEALDRELQRMLEEEEITALMILLNED